ncbi:hypothetical protein LTR16_011501, partial [Cryomyces antarcticus]
MLAGFGKKKSDRRMPMNMPSTEATAQLSEKEKGGGMPRTDSPPDFGVVTDQEWHQAARAARTATWGAIFYLITTDVLGPYSVPWAMSQMGYGPGVTLYTVFGALAG